MKNLFLPIFLFIIISKVNCQPVPAAEENIPYLIIFGPKADPSWGDYYHSQTFFFLIPETFKDPVYIRVYDPDCGGEIDEMNGFFDTQTLFAIYGGKGAYTDKDAQGTEPVGNYKSGNLLAKKIFGVDPKYDKNWYTFGPFNPTEGEYYKKFNGYIFKAIAEGLSGDDGNMYRYYLSTKPNENKPVEGANAFAFEYCFRMWDNPKEVSHIYPFVDDRTISIKLSNFDWDDDGIIRIVSVARKGQNCKVSGNNAWIDTEFKIYEEEKNTSLDIQFIKNMSSPVKNNNVVVNVKNQYGESLPFYTSPIGGIPKFKPSIRARPDVKGPKK